MNTCHEQCRLITPQCHHWWSYNHNTCRLMLLQVVVCWVREWVSVGGVRCCSLAHQTAVLPRDAAMLARSWESYSCPSVCASVCLSITRVLCDKTKQRTADILIPHDKAITLVFWHQQWLVSDAPSVWNLRSKWPTLFEKRRLRQISAYNVSTVGDSQKCSIMIIASWPWAFQWAAKL